MERPYVIGEASRHRRSTSAWATIRTLKRSHWPAKVVTVHAQARCRTMNIPILGKTVRLPNLSAATIPVCPVLTLDKRCVYLSAASRNRKGGLHLLVGSKHGSTLDFCHTPFGSCFVDRRIDQVRRRTITWAFRTPSFSRAFWQPLLAERLQDGLFVGMVFIARDQSWRLVLQAFRRVFYQQFRVFFRSFAVDHFQHEFVFGIQGSVIPVIAASGINRIVFVAILLFFPNEVPLFVELHLVCVGGKIQQVCRVVARRVAQQAGYNGSPFADALSSNGLFYASHFLPRRVPEWKLLSLLATANRKKPFLGVRKRIFCKRDNTTIASCWARIGLERGYFLHRKRRVFGTLYSGNKSFSSHP